VGLPFRSQPNVTLVVPGDGGDELAVFSSTQNPVKTQNFVAMVSKTRQAPRARAYHDI